MKEFGIINTNDYEEYYKEKYGKYEEKSLSTHETQDLYYLCQIARENNLKLFVLGFFPYSNYICIHKTPDEKWVVSTCSKKWCTFIEGTFNNIYDACVFLIDKCASKDNKKHAINEFDKRLNNTVNDEELDLFANKIGYIRESLNKEYTLNKKIN